MKGYPKVVKIDLSPSPKKKKSIDKIIREKRK
jgi:hypothetical protein